MAYDKAIQIYEYYLFNDWKANGVMFPPIIDIILNDGSLELPFYQDTQIMQPTNLFIFKNSYKDASSKIQNQFFKSCDNYFMFDSSNFCGCVLRDRHFYEREIILRRFGFIWLLTIYAKSNKKNIPAHILKALKEELVDGYE